MPETPKVYKAISDVQRRVAEIGIAKERQSSAGGGYKYRGIDDITQVISSVMAECGLVILPNVEERSVCERQSKSGNSLFYVTVNTRFDFVSAEDGSTHSARIYGEAMDMSDKATNKAMSAALKYCLLHTFLIPLEGERQDTEEENHQVQRGASTGYSSQLNATNTFNKAKAILDQGFLDGISGLSSAWGTLSPEMKSIATKYKDKLKAELEA